MPAKRRRTKRTDTRVTLDKRLVEIQAEIAKLKRKRAAVKRGEFVEMTKSLQQLHRNSDDLAIQLTRISQIQAEVDLIKNALRKAKLLD